MYFLLIGMCHLMSFDLKAISIRGTVSSPFLDIGGDRAGDAPSRPHTVLCGMLHDGPVGLRCTLSGPTAVIRRRLLNNQALKLSPRKSKTKSHSFVEKRKRKPRSRPLGQRPPLLADVYLSSCTFDFCYSWKDRLERQENERKCRTHGGLGTGGPSAAPNPVC